MRKPNSLGSEVADAQADERALLAALLRSGETEGGGALDDATAFLRPEDFAIYSHRLAFGAIVGVRAAGQPVLAASVHEELRRRGQLAEFGANASTWLADLLEMAATSAHAMYFAGRVRDRARLRNLAHALAEASSQVADPTGCVDEVCGRVEALVLGASDSERGEDEFRPLRDLVDEELQAIDRRADGGPVGISTGFRELDALLCGLRGGQLVVLGARPAVGKSSLAASLAANVAEVGTHVLFASLEMPRDEIVQRLLAGAASVPLLAIRSGKLTPNQASRVEAAARELRRLPLDLNEIPRATVTRLAARARRAVRRRGCGLVVIDYLQLLVAENERENRNGQIGLQSRQLKLLARELNVPVIVLAQLNRESENRPDPRPRLADLRDSGEIEQHGDIVLLLHQPREQTDQHRATVEVMVAKNRNGPTGTAMLARVRATTRFEAA